MSKFSRIGIVYLLFWGVPLFLSTYPGEAGVQFIGIGIFTYLIAKLCLRRTLSPVIRWGRWALFGVGLVYTGLLVSEALLLPHILWTEPSAQWMSWSQAWSIINFFIIILSSPEWIRQITRLQAHPARFIVSVYTGAALLCSLILVLPVSTQPDASFSFLEAIFTSVSAISGAGLLTLSVPETFSRFGQIVIMIFIQAGGIGIITFSGILLLVIGKELGLHNKIIQDDTEKIYFLGSVKRFATFAALFMIIVESIGVILLYPSMRLLYDSPMDALFHSLFQVISAICTAGISSMPGGLVDFQGAFSPLFILSLIALLGGLGAPTIIQIVQYFNWRSSLRRISAYGKLEIFTGLFFVIVGFLVLLFLEWNNPFHESFYSVAIHSFVQSSMRAAGFNSMDISSYTEPGQIFLLHLTLIGGAPVSTAGGIKTGTLAIIAIFVLSFLRNNLQPHFAGRRIPQVLFTKAVSIAVIYILIGLVGALGLYLSNQIGAFQALFESFSALGVCGWTLGVTPHLNPVGQMIIILLMMIGRIGVLTAIYFFVMRRKRKNYQYAQGEFYVG